MGKCCVYRDMAPLPSYAYKPSIVNGLVLSFSYLFSLIPEQLRYMFAANHQTASRAVGDAESAEAIG